MKGSSAASRESLIVVIAEEALHAPRSLSRPSPAPQLVTENRTSSNHQ